MKAGILTALAGAVAVALAGFAMSDDLTKRGHGELTLLALTGITVAISLAAAYVGLWPREWRRDPNPETLIGEYSKQRYPDGNSLIAEVTANLKESYSHNRPGLRVKVRALQVAQLFLGVTVVLGVAVVIAHLLSW